jgi:hypothetical protein
MYEISLGKDLCLSLPAEVSGLFEFVLVFILGICSAYYLGLLKIPTQKTLLFCSSV